MYKPIAIAGLLAAQTLFTIPLEAQVAPPSDVAIRRFEQVIDSIRSRLGIPGMSAAVAFNDSVIWSRGFGYADLATHLAATPHTPYEVASLSKPLGTVLLLRLVERGKLGLNDPMSKYSPDYRSDSVRIYHVLTHTSEGIPGTNYNYNGDLFANLFDPIVRSSGRRYREMMSTDILIPLRMNETAPGNDLRPGQPAMDTLLGPANNARYDSILQRLATPYRTDSTGQVLVSPEFLFGLSPANGIVSTVLDLEKFDAAIDHNVLLGVPMTRQMWTPARAPDGHAFPYALGWFVQPYGDQRLVWHNGNLPSRYSALYLKVPAAGLTLVILANSDALSSPFQLAQGDVTRSAFACAFLSIVIHKTPPQPPACTTISDDLIAHWREAHGLQRP